MRRSKCLVWSIRCNFCGTLDSVCQLFCIIVGVLEQSPYLYKAFSHMIGVPLPFTHPCLDTSLCLMVNVLLSSVRKPWTQMQPTGTSWLLTDFCVRVLSWSTQMVKVLSVYFILQGKDSLEAQSPWVVQSVAVQLTRYKCWGWMWCNIK